MLISAKVGPNLLQVGPNLFELDPVDSLTHFHALLCCMMLGAASLMLAFQMLKQIQMV